MGEFCGLIICCLLTGLLVFDSTSVTIDVEEIIKLNNYCKVNQGVNKVKYTTTDKRKITCVDGAIFEINK